MNRAMVSKQITEVPMKKGVKKLSAMRKGAYKCGGAVKAGYKAGGKVSADMCSPRKAMAMGLK